MGADRVLMTSPYEGTCNVCGGPIKKGDRVLWVRGVTGAKHVMCSDEAEALRERLAPSRAVDAVIDVPAPPGKAYMPFQRGGIAFAFNLFAAGKPGVLIADQMGLGKEQPNDTPVMTVHGYVPMGSIRVDDTVTGSDGKPTRVSGVFPQGIKKIYRVTFSDGSSTECGGDHLWTLYYQLRKERCYFTVTTDQLRTGATINRQKANGQKTRLSLAKAIKGQRAFLPMLSGPAQMAQTSALPIPPYTMGALLANGSLTGSTPVLTTNTKDWSEVHAHLLAERVEIGAVDVRGNNTRASILNTVAKVRATRTNVLSGKKRIPGDYFLSSCADRIALLHGMMDGDGSCSKTRNKVAYHSTSKGLSEDVVRLVETLGGIASIRPYDRRKEGKPIEYQVRIRLPESVPPFRVKRKKSRYSFSSHCAPTRSIKSVRFSRWAEATCIRVEAPDHLYATEHCILTHNTIEAIGVINAHPHMRRVIVVCPASLRVNWREELERWLVRPHLVHVARSGGEVQADDAAFDAQICKSSGGTLPLVQPEVRVSVVSYNLLGMMMKEHPDFTDGMQWDLLVFDEAHYVKNEKSLRTQAVRAVGKHSTNRAALTGTPIPNAVAELFTILSILDPFEWDPPGTVKRGKEKVKVGMGEGAGFFQFAKTYAGAIRKCVIHKDRRVCEIRPQSCRTHWEFGGSSNLDALQEKLRTTIMVRRMKRDVLTELPPKVRQVLKLPVDGFGAILKRERAQWKELGTDPEMALEKGEPIPFEKMSEVRHDLAVMKIPHVVELCEQALTDTDEKIIVFAHHRDVLEELHAKLSGFGSVILYGGQGDFSKNQSVRSFQDDPKTRVFCGGITAAGVGLTLTASTHVIFAEESYVPMHVDQAEDRAHRIGQTSSVLVQHPVVDKSLDARMVELIVAKQAVADLALDIGLLDEKGKRINESPERARERELLEVGMTEKDVKALQEDLAHWATTEKFPADLRDVGRELARQPKLSPHQARRAREIMGKKTA